MKKKMTILYEDASLMVCVKPAGMAAQTARVGEKDVVSEARNRRASAGEEPYIALINRLDQPVSGLIVLAKDQKSANLLNRSMQAGKWKKEYLARVHGIPEKKKAVLTDWIRKEKRENLSRIVPEGTPQAKRAALRYEVIAEDVKAGNAELLICLETGRHHQIRVQMANAGYPLAGDRRYGEERETGQEEYKGLYLCAYSLEFPHPLTGEKMHFSTTPPWRNDV